MIEQAVSYELPILTANARPRSYVVRKHQLTEVRNLSYAGLHRRDRYRNCRDRSPYCAAAETARDSAGLRSGGAFSVMPIAPYFSRDIC